MLKIVADCVGDGGQSQPMTGFENVAGKSMIVASANVARLNARLADWRIKGRVPQIALPLFAFGDFGSRRQL